MISGPGSPGDRSSGRRAGGWRWSRALLLTLAVAATTLAWRNPALVLPRHLYSYVFVLDVTQSMNVVDMQVGGQPASRLEFARTALRDTLAALPCGSEAGFAMFTEHRALLLFSPVEVCAHYSAMIDTLDRLDWRIAWAQRSEVMKGLFSALSMTDQLGEPTRLVFVTDGHEAPPIHADFRLPLAEYRGLKGLVVGVGGGQPVPIPMLDDDGKLLGFWRAADVQQIDNYSIGRSGTLANEGMQGVDSTDLRQRIADGTEHLSSLKEQHLSALAREAGLDYVRAATITDLRRALNDPAYAYRTDARTGLHAFLALLAVACLIVGLPSGRGRGADYGSRRRRRNAAQHAR